MKVIAVDDEQIALDNLKLTLSEIKEITEVTVFRSPKKALEWLESHSADVAFLDIRMRQLDGLNMAKQVKDLQPDCAVIFVTGYEQYAFQAIQLHVSGYLMKPVLAEDILRELDYIRTLPSAPAQEGQKLKIQCFGNFEVFADGEPLKFKYSKTKELMAYLVDRGGAFCTNGELIAVLWRDDADIHRHSSHFRNLRSDLFTVLSAAGCGDTVRKQRGLMAVVPDKIECDYFAWRKGEICAVNAYRGEYMAQYSWGEFTLGDIEMSVQR